ncbi:hypothetical protein B0H10DRAFT_2354966 [Mycena sp. CBHHK59/15]|nr:hypothetical protein B0H10DRAFT_2354966 [Mycena sp. CBHHK59/15]
MFHSGSARFPAPNHNRGPSSEQDYRERSSGSYESDEETSRRRISSGSTHSGYAMNRAPEFSFESLSAVAIGQASHETLLASGNHAHRDLYRAYEVSQGQLSVLTTAYTKLTQAVAAQSTSKSPLDISKSSSKFGSTSSRPLPSPAEKSDYPGVRFWTRKEYNMWTEENTQVTQLNNKAKSRGSKRLSEGENCCTLYIETEDGVSVDGDRAKEMRDHVYALFSQIGIEGKLPKTWKRAGAEVNSYYRSKMLFGSLNCVSAPDIGNSDSDFESDDEDQDNTATTRKRKRSEKQKSKPKKKRAVSRTRNTEENPQPNSANSREQQSTAPENSATSADLRPGPPPNDPLNVTSWSSTASEPTTTASSSTASTSSTTVSPSTASASTSLTTVSPSTTSVSTFSSTTPASALSSTASASSSAATVSASSSTTPAAASSSTASELSTTTSSTALPSASSATDRIRSEGISDIPEPGSAQNEASGVVHFLCLSFIEMLTLSKQVDPLTRIFGPASVPDGRAAAVAKDTVIIEESVSSASASQKSAVPTTAQKIKPTDLTTARNLYHIEYRKSHGAITSAELKSLWNTLPDDEKAVMYLFPARIAAYIQRCRDGKPWKAGKSESQTQTRQAKNDDQHGRHLEYGCKFTDPCADISFLTRGISFVDKVLYANYIYILLTAKPLQPIEIVIASFKSLAVRRPAASIHAPEFLRLWRSHTEPWPREFEMGTAMVGAVELERG